MTYYRDNHIRIYCIDFRKNELPDECVQMVCTSPPYWGLRKYAGEQELIWGGDKDCEHKWGEAILAKQSGGGWAIPKEQSTYEHDIGKKDFQLGTRIQGCFCSLCGAWKGAYGLEPSPGMYVSHSIEILREIRRVLRKDGVVFWNIGDSYMSSPSNQYGDGVGQRYKTVGQRQKRIPSGSIKTKDLCLIPFRVAIAAQEDGWWVRSVIIWAKNNPMPESVTDRPTESHEYILMLTKSAKYYWDQEAVREPYIEPLNRWGGDSLKRDTSKTAEYKEMQNIGYSSAFRVGRPMRPDPSGRNIRSVWEFPTTPYPEAHFAVFPEKLPELCIKAATPEVGCCSKCGAPWVRITKSRIIPQYECRHGGFHAKGTAKGMVDLSKTWTPGTKEVETLGWQPTCKCEITEQMKRAGCDSSGNYSGTDQKDYGEAKAQSPSDTKKRILKSMRAPKTTKGWQGTCDCEAARVPSLVLDPMMGAGTTLLVAKNLNRYAVGYELAAEYCQLAVERCRQQVLL